MIVGARIGVSISETATLNYQQYVVREWQFRKKLHMIKIVLVEKGWEQER